MSFLKVRNLSKIYGPNKGLLPINFDVARGEMVAIVGHNGAGKSTLMKLLATWIPTASGQVVIDGVDLKNRENATRKIGFVPEIPNLFENFSVEYNLKLFAELFQTPRIRVEEVLKEFGLLSFRSSKVRELSKGWRQRVSIGRTLLANPCLLLFDEPTSGLDFEMTKYMYRVLTRLHGLGKTVLFTTHRPEEIENFATRIMLLHGGSKVFDGNPEEYFKSLLHKKLYA